MSAKAVGDILIKGRKDRFIRALRRIPRSASHSIHAYGKSQGNTLQESHYSMRQNITTAWILNVLFYISHFDLLEFDVRN